MYFMLYYFLAIFCPNIVAQGIKTVTWNVQKPAKARQLSRLSSKRLSSPIFMIRYSKYPDNLAPHTHIHTVTNICRV